MKLSELGDVFDVGWSDFHENQTDALARFVCAL